MYRVLRRVQVLIGRAIRSCQTSRRTRLGVLSLYASHLASYDILADHLVKKEDMAHAPKQLVSRRLKSIKLRNG
jgi:hypothetical protein